VRTGITMSADYTCTYCEQRGDSFNGPDGAPWTMDHVIPLERGGEPGPRNVVLSCATCNREKGSRTPEEWRDA
jgi:5-methylcytosine-specific restriction endonuclease McrA